jgi:hypothetical protein
MEERNNFRNALSNTFPVSVQNHFICMRIFNLFLTMNDQLLPNPLPLDLRNEARVCYSSNVWKPTAVCVTALVPALFALIMYGAQFHRQSEASLHW